MAGRAVKQVPRYEILESSSRRKSANKTTAPGVVVLRRMADVYVLPATDARRIPFYAVRIIKGCVREKKGRRKKKGKRERFKADQYFIFERRCHDGNRYLKIEKHDTTSHFELKRAGGGCEKTRGGEERKGERERESELKEQRSRRRTGSAAARRNSSLVKGAIIQGIAPGPQTAHKLWAFNFAILTGRSDECRGEARFLKRLSRRRSSLPLISLSSREH
ncbi:hypothetical protein DBV15_05149 [Temnothorax longispinosus]|uniref:Uncharacterized protein n=1 Tax=Temnothorax longispinosus TaxID=300112 RepID=A0A4S2KVF1_9HYME|nr:hypothetical protein DBV15_05149 [Temnothorax longispinosus]